MLRCYRYAALDDRLNIVVIERTRTRAKDWAIAQGVTAPTIALVDVRKLAARGVDVRELVGRGKHGG